MSLFSKKSKPKQPEKPKFETRIDSNDNLYPLLGPRGHDDLESVINDFDEVTRCYREFNFVCGPDFETKKGKKKLEQGCENFGAMGAGKIYFVAACTVLGNYKRGFLIAEDGFYFVDNDGTPGHYSWEQYDAATVRHSYTDIKIEDHQFLTAEAEMLGSLLESLQNK